MAIKYNEIRLKGFYRPILGKFQLTRHKWLLHNSEINHVTCRLKEYILVAVFLKTHPALSAKVRTGRRCFGSSKRLQPLTSHMSSTIE